MGFLSSAPTILSENFGPPRRFLLSGTFPQTASSLHALGLFRPPRRRENPKEKNVPIPPLPRTAPL